MTRQTTLVCDRCKEAIDDDAVSYTVQAVDSNHNAVRKTPFDICAACFDFAVKPSLLGEPRPCAHDEADATTCTDAEVWCSNCGSLGVHCHDGAGEASTEWESAR